MSGFFVSSGPEAPGCRSSRHYHQLWMDAPNSGILSQTLRHATNCPQTSSLSHTHTYTHTHTHTHNWKWMSPISIIPTQDDTQFSPHSSPSRALFQSRYLAFTHTPYDPHSHQRVRKWSLNLHVWLGCTCQNSSRRHGMKLNVLKTVSLKVTDFSTRLPTGKRLDCLHIQYVMHLMYF